MEALRIRPATVDDVHAMVDLNRQLGYPTAEPELRMRLEPILASANDGVLIAIEDTRPIAWVHVAIERTLEATDVAVVRGLVVDEAHRFYEREGYVHVKTSHVFTKPLV